jgi:hypothetical protein
MTTTRVKSILILALLLLSTISTMGVISVSADTKIADFDVSSDGTAVWSPVLEFGRMYRIVATEVFTVAPGVTADAMYYTDDGTNTWFWSHYHTLADGHSFLQMNGNDIDWGPFSNGGDYHTYTIEVVGTGAALMFQIHDWIDEDYTNNQCHLRVRIYTECDRFYGLTPGFWKNHVDRWVGYEPEWTVVQVWTDFGYVDQLDTLLDALEYPGGKGLEGAARILYRAAVAAVLNAAHPNINYPLDTTEIDVMVMNALNSYNRGVMLDLATLLDDYNNAGAPWED